MVVHHCNLVCIFCHPLLRYTRGACKSFQAPLDPVVWSGDRAPVVSNDYVVVECYFRFEILKCCLGGFIFAEHDVFGVMWQLFLEVLLILSANLLKLDA